MRIGALEAGGTKMVMAVGNEHGEIRERVSIPTETPEITMPKIIAFFKERKIEKLGIGSFGPVCLDKGSSRYGHILETPKLAWRNFDILGELERGLRVACYLDTDVNAAAVGEATWGNSKDVKNSIYITVGTGIGAGIIVDGKPVHGLLHPEAGHILVQRKEGDSFEGVCPYHKACLEGMASGPAIEKRWGISAKELQDKVEVWELEAHYLAQAIMNYILILSPKRIILGGGVMHQEQVIPLIREDVKRLLAGYICMPELNDMEHFIVTPKLNDNQGIMGCIQLTQME